ncbi:MAG: Ig-like domain-containing protein, partial [Fidelibacterota bacterium]
MIKPVNTPNKSTFLLFTVLLTGLFLFTTCDDRIPTDSGKKETTSSDTYTLKVTAQPFYRDAEGNSYYVGEDLTDLNTYTLIIAQLLDSLNAPVAGKLISFSAKVKGNSFGSFDLNSTYTDGDGFASAVFDDGGQSAYDNPATATYDGVTVTATYVYRDLDLNTDYIFQGDVRFDVFDTSNVDLWPYRFRLLKDTDVINLNIDTAKAVISAKLTTKIYGKPIKNLEVFFESDKGSLSELSALTDSTGYARVDFRASGDPNDVGVSTITARYQHPVFGIVSDSVQVSIIDTTFSGCPAYIEIPPAHPGEVMIVGGGGIESTDIEARVYDENGILVDTPIKVTFTLGPEIPMGANLNNVGPVDTAYTVNGVATVSLNSGTAPGPVRVTA